MANIINWGSVYCEMEQDGSFGADTLWSTNAINDIAAPTCWITFKISTDTTLFTTDTTNLTTDRTQL
jgi:hypothetical protein